MKLQGITVEPSHLSPQQVSLRGKSSITKHKVKNQILLGDSCQVMKNIPPQSVDLSFWSPPYFVGKSYEQNLGFDDWKSLIRSVIFEHSRVLKSGGFMAINIADILCFKDSHMPRFQAENIRGKRSHVTTEEVLSMRKKYPSANRYKLAEILGCSEQTVHRRLEGNHVRGGKQSSSTKIKLTGCMVADWAEQYGLYLYDQRIWHKDPTWQNSQWHSSSYRAVDEFEHIYIFWCPGVVQYDRSRLEKHEWAEWGSRGVWQIRSVRKNVRHEAEFPEELARRVIKLFSPKGGLVLDPFVGTGTTTSVAKKMGRKRLGIDVVPEYVDMAQIRTNDA